MGLFEKNTMRPEDRALLFTWIAYHHVKAFLEHSYWMTPNDRAQACNVWLEQQGHNAGFLYLGKLCNRAEKFAKALTATEDKPSLIAAKDALNRFFRNEALTAEEKAGVDSLLRKATDALRAARLN